MSYKTFLSPSGPGATSFDYLYDPNLVVTNTNNNVPIGTGGFRPAFTTDFAANINVSGLSLTVGNVAVTGGQVSLIGTSAVNVTNPVLAVSGIVQASTYQVGVTGSPTVVAVWSGTNTVSSTAPSGANGTALSANNNRSTWFLQNHATGTSPLYVKFGAAASAQSFNFILKPASSAGIGDGGSFIDDGGRWKGIVAVSGQNPSYSVWETTT